MGGPPPREPKTPTGCGTAAPASPPDYPARSPASRGRRRCTPCRPCSSRSRPGIGGGAAGDPARREHGRWEHAGQPYFDGEVEPCINGRTLAAGAYFGVDSTPIVARLLGEQLADGGWNCEAETARCARRSTRRSRARGTARVRAGDGRHRRGPRRPPRRRGVPPRAPAVPAQEHRRGRRPGLPRVRLPLLLALRRAAGAGLLPRRRLGARSPDGRGRRRRPVQAAARRSVAPRPHPPRSGALRRRRRRRRAQPVEHAAGAARARMVGRRRA